jgi:hypothetical protein
MKRTGWGYCAVEKIAAEVLRFNEDRTIRQLEYTKKGLSLAD